MSRYCAMFGLTDQRINASQVLRCLTTWMGISMGADAHAAAGADVDAGSNAGGSVTAQPEATDGNDAVDQYIAQWAHERPGLDVSPMAIVGRVSRLAAHLQTRLDRVFAEFGLQSWEFDVMATLVRSGAPYELTPGDLDRTMMITSGTTTHRIVKLEHRGFVTRRRDDDDRRVVRVRLTDSGRQIFDAAHVAHLDNERRLLEPLADEDRVQLLRGLRALSVALGDVPSDVRTPRRPV